MLDSVYNAKILEFAGNIERIGKLDTYDAMAKAHSKLCGSTVEVFLTLDDDRVSDFSHKVKACALGQASSSIMARVIIGSTKAELREQVFFESFESLADFVSRFDSSSSGSDSGFMLV